MQDGHCRALVNQQSRPPVRNIFEDIESLQAASYDLDAEEKEHEGNKDKDKDKDCGDKGLGIAGEAVQEDEYDYDRNPDNLL